jgi:nucleoside-diphosphate-sugar epimerase
MKVFITGVNGFIGSFLASYLHGQGAEVSGCSRSATLKSELEGIVERYYPAHLNEDYAADMFAEVDAVVHGAHSFEGEDNVRRNVEGTKAWYAAAKDAGIGNQVFLTSYSAKPGSGSEYAEIKHQLQEFFVAQQQPVIRPGLVLGDGGLFGRMMKMVKSLPLMPLLDGGKHFVPIVSIQTLAEVAARVLRKPEPRIYNIFQPQQIRLVDMLREIKQQLRTVCLFVPVPSILPLLVLKTIELLHIPFPVKSANITALKENQALDLPSHLPELKLEDLSLREIVQLAVKR